MSKRRQLILFCNCRARNESVGWTTSSAKLALHPEYGYVILEDLCGLCAMDPAKIAGLIDNASRVLLIACNPRAVKLLLLKAGVVEMEKISFVNLSEEDPSKLVPAIEKFIGQEQEMNPAPGLSEWVGEAAGNNRPGPPVTVMQQSDPSWSAWYPVIDYSRCNHCGQCADFCLFSVYRKSADRVEVVNPANCKDNCPACARICPGVAIVFPKYSGEGAIGGSDSIDERFEMQRLQQDTENILGDDIYKALEQRKLKRRMIIREDLMQKAILERDQAMEQAGADKTIQIPKGNQK